MAGVAHLARYAYSLIFGDWSTKLLVLASITNFLAFFGRDLFYRARYGHRKCEAIRGAAPRATSDTHCAVCWRDDKSDRTIGVPLLHEMLSTARLLQNHLREPRAREHRHLIQVV